MSIESHSLAEATRLWKKNLIYIKVKYQLIYLLWKIFHLHIKK